MIRKFTLTLAIFILTGCNRAGVLPPTPIPEDHLPTVVALTAAAIIRAMPTEAVPTSSTTPTTIPSQTHTPLPAPTATHTPTPGPVAPSPAIQILSPGPMSKVISPIILKGYIRPGAKGFIQVDLLGEDGRLLTRVPIYRESILVEGAYVRLEIPFETRAAAEVGRLQISTKDEFGRPLETKSVHLLLLSLGENDINLGDSPYARSSIFYPSKKDIILGGTLPIIGEIQAFNDLPVILELLDEEGKTIGLRTLSLPEGSREIFETTITYKVKEQTSARLIIRQADKRFEGNVYLHSQEVNLNP